MAAFLLEAATNVSSEVGRFRLFLLTRMHAEDLVPLTGRMDELIKLQEYDALKASTSTSSSTSSKAIDKQIDKSERKLDERCLI